MKIEIEYYSDRSRVNHSLIKAFEESPRLAKDIMDGKVDNKPSAAMKNGTMVHMYLLQHAEFKKKYKILDFAVPTSAQQKKFCEDYVKSKAATAILKATEALKANYVTTSKNEEETAAKALEMALKLKPYIKWLKASNADEETITWAKLNALKLTKEQLQLHKKANELLFKNDSSPGVITHNEFHINWEIEVRKGSIIPCKSLIDRLIIDHDAKKVTLIDLKTTVSVSKFKDSFKEYSYGTQMAYYWMAIYWYFKNELKLDIEEYEHSTYIVAIQNDGATCKVFEVDDETIITNIDKLTHIITQMDWHFSNNLWDYSREYYEGDGAELLLYDNT